MHCILESDIKKRKTQWTEIFSIFFVIFVSNSLADSSQLVCYYPSWAVYRNEPYTFTPSDIDPYLCTHVIWAFGGVQGDVIEDLDEDQKGRLDELVSLKQQNSDLKILLSIGGSVSSERFQNITVNQESVTKFAQSAMKFLESHHLDGLDINWEFPEIAQRDSFSNLLKVIKNAMHDSGNSNLILSVALGSNKYLIEHVYDVETISKTVDLVSLITYDLHGQWNAETGLHSQLYPQNPDWPYFSQNWVVNSYLQRQLDPAKTLLGLPFYGRSFTMCASESRRGIGATTCGGGTMGPITKEQGVKSYLEMCDDSGWTHTYDNVSKSIYSYKDNQWIGYENIQSLHARIDYIKNSSLAGAMIWDLSHDDFMNKCGGGSYPLLKTLAAGLGIVPAPANTTTVTTTTTTRTTTTHSGSSAQMAISGSITVYFSLFVFWRCIFFL